MQESPQDARRVNMFLKAKITLYLRISNILIRAMTMTFAIMYNISHLLPVILRIFERYIK